MGWAECPAHKKQENWRYFLNPHQQVPQIHWGVGEELPRPVEPNIHTAEQAAAAASHTSSGRSQRPLKQHGLGDSFLHLSRAW